MRAHLVAYAVLNVLGDAVEVEELLIRGSAGARVRVSVRVRVRVRIRVRVRGRGRARDQG